MSEYGAGTITRLESTQPNASSAPSTTSTATAKTIMRRATSLPFHHWAHSPDHTAVGVIAVRAGGEQRDGGRRNLLDQFQVADDLVRQRVATAEPSQVSPAG